jgi:hypothetical protein
LVTAILDGIWGALHDRDSDQNIPGVWWSFLAAQA